MSREDTQLLEIYLDDHWAGASAGRSLSKRMFRNNRGTEWADRLGWLVSQIEEDDTTLSRVRAALGIDGGKLKRTLALAGNGSLASS